MRVPGADTASASANCVRSTRRGTTRQIPLPAEIDPTGPDSIADFAEFTADAYDDRAALLADADLFDATVRRSFAAGGIGVAAVPARR